MMNDSFDLEMAAEVLRRTPGILRSWLQGLPELWVRGTEGPGTWSPFDVLGHLIHGEKTDWIPRAEWILSGHSEEPFEPFDRFAQFEDSRGKSLENLLDEFEELRRGNLERLGEMSLEESDLALEGTHPEFGKVSLCQLLATWAAHDLSHLAQISRAMAFQLKEEVGPWRKYLGVFRR